MTTRKLPPITEPDRQHLIEQICQGAVGYKDIKDRPVKTTVTIWLSGIQQALLDKYAPERLALSNGRLFWEGEPRELTRPILRELYGAEYRSLHLDEVKIADGGK